MEKSISLKCPVCIASMCPARQFVCPTCSFRCCKPCMRTYVLAALEPSCMNPDCRRTFSSEVLLDQMPNNFRSQYRDHQATLVLERERQRLPDSTVIAPRKIKIKRLDTKIAQTIADLEIMKRERYDLVLQNSHDTHSVNVERRSFIKRCAAENCNGFLSTAYKCQICEKRTCVDCNVVRETDAHECRPEDIETTKLLKSDTKNCPRCAVPIYRSSGCPQMFCVQCHTAFDWNTLRIIDGPIHNPHYFEIQSAMAANGIEATRPVTRGLDLPCNQTTHDTMTTMFSRLTLFSQGIQETNRIIQRSLMHIMEYSMREFSPELNLEWQRETFRLNFLMSNVVYDEINEKRFKTFTEENWLQRLKLQQSEIMRTKGNHDILQTYLHTMCDLLVKLNDTAIPAITTYSEMELLRKLVNNALAKNCNSLSIARRKITKINTGTMYMNLVTVKPAGKK